MFILIYSCSVLIHSCIFILVLFDTIFHWFVIVLVISDHFSPIADYLCPPKPSRRQIVMFEVFMPKCNINWVLFNDFKTHIFNKEPQMVDCEYFDDSYIWWILNSQWRRWAQWNRRMTRRTWLYIWKVKGFPNASLTKFLGSILWSLLLINLIFSMKLHTRIL